MRIAYPIALSVMVGLGCATGSSGPTATSTAPAAASAWRYELAVDDALTTMQLGVCLIGPAPTRLVAGEGAGEFVTSARVRGGPELEREGDALILAELGDDPCVDIDIDLASLADDNRWGGTLIDPTSWLWHPRAIPDALDATLQLALPTGVHLTGPWPAEPDGRRRLDVSAFRWSGWVALGRFDPIEFESAGCEFEVAVVGAEPTASDEGIKRWISAAAESQAQLFGRFSRERVSVVVIVGDGWGSDPVHFGMVRRGGGASAMLILDTDARDPELPGEWVSVHEFLHFSMPLVGDAWMSEGFVTYYTSVLRARRGLMGNQADHSASNDETDLDRQTRLALESLAAGFDRARTNLRTLRYASEVMRAQATYGQTYWGGAAVAMALDLRVRVASGGQRSLDDLMIRLAREIPDARRWSADEVLELFDRELAAWKLGETIVPSAIADLHLDARSIPAPVAELDGLAVEVHDGRVRLLAEPADQVALRESLFTPKSD